MSMTSPIDEFPFGTRLSLAHLIDFWERQDGDPSSLHAPLARVIVEKLEEAPGAPGDHRRPLGAGHTPGAHRPHDDGYGPGGSG